MIAPNIKWDQNWRFRVKASSKNLDDNKNKQVESLLTQGSALQTEKTKLTKEIRQLKQEQTGLSQIFLYHRQAQKEVDRLNNATNKATHNPREKNFLGTGVGTKYQTNGWLKAAENHFKPATGKLDNLYKVKTASGEVETTEEQVLNTLARVVKALQKVDASDFEAKYNAKESDTTKQSQVKAYLKEIQDQAKEIIIGSAKDSEGNAKQPTYDFSHNYHKGKFNDSGNWQADATDYSQPALDYQHFFDFISLVHGQAFLSDLDKDKHKNVDKNEPWTIFLKGEKWEVEKLKDYGIAIDSTKTTLYKTSETDKITTPAGQGISGWLDLANSISQNMDNQTKLTAAFTNSPTQQLLSDLNGWTQGADGFLSDGTNFTLPESLESAEIILAELEADKLASSNKKATLVEKIDQKTAELKQKEADLKVKESELDVLIKEIVAKQREKLTAYKITDGFADANKRTEAELWNIRQILENIRYLEKDGDSTLPSSESSENTAYDQITDLQNQCSSYGGKLWLIRDFENLAFKMAGGKEEYDINQAIERIKAGKYTDLDGKEQQVYYSLDKYHQQFEQKAQLVKLSAREEQAQAALKAAIEKKDDTEKLPDWQAKLKALDPLITETVFTQKNMEDFQKHTNFGNISTVEGLLKEVMEADATDNTKFKVKADFITLLKKEDAEVDDLAKMLTKFSAEKVIKLIKQFDYEKKPETEQKELRRKFSWDRSKKINDKFVGESEDYTLPETDKEDFQKFLYQLATGAKSLNSISKPTGRNEDNSPTGEDKETGFMAHLKRNKIAYSVCGVLLIAAIGATIFFWDKIKSLLGAGSSEESEDNE